MRIAPPGGARRQVRMLFCTLSLYIYIIYIERERERERIYMYVYMCIYIYICYILIYIHILCMYNRELLRQAVRVIPTKN